MHVAPDALREMLELRKKLHAKAYQHKTVKKLELHMIDVLKIADKHVRVTGVGGRKMSMSEAASPHSTRKTMRSPVLGSSLFACAEATAVVAVLAAADDVAHRPRRW